MNLHLPTLLIIIITLSLSLSAAMAFMSVHNKKVLGGWAVGLFLQSLGYVFLAARGHISDFVSIVLGNASLLSSLALYIQGLFWFERRKVPYTYLWGGVLIVSILQTWWMEPQYLGHRIVLISLSISLMCLVMFVLLWMGRRVDHLRGRYIVMVGASLVGLISVWRIVALGRGSIDVVTFTAGHPVQLLLYASSIVSVVLMSMGLLMMSQERSAKEVQKAQKRAEFIAQSIEQSGQELSFDELMVYIMGKMQDWNVHFEPVVMLKTKNESIAIRLIESKNASVVAEYLQKVGFLGGRSPWKAVFEAPKVIYANTSATEYDPAILESLQKMGYGAFWCAPIEQDLNDIAHIIGVFCIFIKKGAIVDTADLDLFKECTRIGVLAWQKHQNKERLRVSEQKYQQLIESAHEGIGVVQDQLLQFANPKLIALLGYEEQSIIGKPWHSFISPEDWSVVQKLGYLQLAQSSDSAERFSSSSLNTALAPEKGGRVKESVDKIQKAQEYTVRACTANASTKWLQITVVPLEWEGRPGWLHFVTDVTEKKRLDESIRDLAYKDPLTQLANRRLFMEHLERSVGVFKRTGQYGAVMFLDMDRFKTLNDTYGHVVGDALLIEVASRLRQCVRSVDTCARFGGDEFVILLSDLSTEKDVALEQCEKIAQKVLHQLSEPYVLTSSMENKSQHIEHFCSVSIGLALFQKGVSDSVLLDHADAAMYQAKESGRGCIKVFEPESKPKAG